MVRLCRAVEALVLSLAFCTVYGAASDDRVFKENFIPGLYGRFFEFSASGQGNPCPRVINHNSRGFAGDSNTWVLPHKNIIENKAACNDGGSLVLKSSADYSNPPEELSNSPIALQTFELMKADSTGFWFGADSRKCGKWDFQDSFIFLVREFDRELRGPYNLNLKSGMKYMFVVAPQFTCIFEDAPRPGPKPSSPVIPGTSTPSVVGTSAGIGTDAGTSAGADAESSAEGKPVIPASAGVPSPGGADISIVDLNDNATNSSTALPPPQENSSPDADVSVVEINDSQSNIEPSPSTDAADETPTDSTSFSDGTDGSDAAASAESSISDDSDILAQSSGDSLCFPADATIKLENGSTKTMDKLELGDRVQVSSGDFSDVFMFTHKVRDSVNEFVKISTASGAELSLTKGHFLYVNGALVAAKSVQTGDELELGSGASTTVEAVSCATSRGLYNPQTIHGDIIVNGVRTSTYTRSVDPTIAHPLLLPLRVAYSLFSMSTSVLDDGAMMLTAFWRKSLRMAIL